MLCGIIIISVHSFLSHVLPVISDTNVSCCHDAKSSVIFLLVSLLLLLPFCCHNVFLFSSCHGVPKECELACLVRITSSRYTFLCFKISLNNQDLFNVYLKASIRQ